MEETLIKAPVIEVLNDYDGVFEGRVMQAVENNQKKGIEMVAKIVIDSGSYRPYCLSWDKKGDTCHLDFYAANRRFGFEHSIQDIAGVIIA